ncbi:hypothetical protein HDV00_001295 [Rhizophlyctis rosea]|nr:hypothetical protein HDV00_001295 [Rhizophlyctis rosea]
MSAAVDAPPALPVAEKDKDKKKKKGKKKGPSIPKDMVLNEKGELVTGKEYALQQILDATNKSLNHFKERMEGLVSTNEQLQEAMQQQEKDALDVIAALHAENEKKDAQAKQLRVQFEAELARCQSERDGIVDDYENRISDMTSALTEKEAAFKVMQQEFSVIKDFRRKRHDLLKQLDTLKLELTDTERRHKDIVARMERKFFEEKIRLQKEANRKISELATKAHREALQTLTETQKDVFRENIRLSDALRVHIQESEDLSKLTTRLEVENRRLEEEKELNGVIVREKIVGGRVAKGEIKHLQMKIQSMEHALSHVVREFEHEREIIGRLARRELEEVRRVAEGLKAKLERRGMEMRHVKRLAQHILDQRTDLERFFMDALDTVRGEILREREQARREAQAEYHRRLRAVAKLGGGVGVTVSVKDQEKDKAGGGGGGDLEGGGGGLASRSKKVDIAELKWEDKERILRLLFARMNGVSLTGGQGADGGGGGGGHEDDDERGYEDGKGSGALWRGIGEQEGRMVDIDEPDIGGNEFSGGVGLGLQASGGFGYAGNEISVSGGAGDEAQLHSPVIVSSGEHPPEREVSTPAGTSPLPPDSSPFASTPPQQKATLLGGLAPMAPIYSMMDMSEEKRAASAGKEREGGGGGGGEDGAGGGGGEIKPEEPSPQIAE